MPSAYKTRYGLDWSPHVPDHQIELYLARFRSLEPYASAAENRTEHFLRAIRLLFSPDDFKINRWTEDIVDGFVNCEELVLFGCASANKSHTCGMVALLDWITAPHVTTTFFCSTDKAALEKRSWASVIHFYTILKKNFPLPAVYSRSRMALLNEDDETLKSMDIDAPEAVKSGLFAVAAMAGNEQQATAKFIGVHQPDPMGGVRMFADEAQAVRKSFTEARTNLMIGTDDFRFAALGNPFQRSDSLGELAEPKRGWNSVSIDGPTTWENKSGGRVVRFDGHRSPAISNPRDFPFLISRKHIDRVMARVRNDTNHPDYLSMVRGWIGSSQNFLSVYPADAQERHKVRALLPPNPFISFPITLCGFDPAFTAKGNNAILVFAQLGTCFDGVRRLVFDREAIRLRSPGETELEGKTLLEFRAREALKILRQRGVPFGQLGVDESGAQTMASVLRMLEPTPLSGEPPLPVVFNAKVPPDMVLSSFDPQPAREHFANLGSLAWGLCELYGRFDQIRGLPDEAGEQFNHRLYREDVMPRLLEDKVDYISRLKESPDAADAVAVLLILARQRFRFLPGGGSASSADLPASGAAMGDSLMNELAAAEESLYST